MTTHALERLGARLVYDVIGEGAAAIVVPGGPGFGSTYLRDSLLPLARRRRLLFVDQRGSGRSDGHADASKLTMATFVEDLDAIRRDSGDDRVDLIGHSFGGLQCLYYSLAHPTKVRRLVLIESDPPIAEEWRKYRDVLAARQSDGHRQRTEYIQSQAGWQSDPVRLETYFRTVLQPYFGSNEPTVRLQFGFGRDAFEKLTVTARAVREDLGDWNIGVAARALRMPALIIYGSQSIFPESAVASTKEALPNARLERIEGVGHFPFLEDPPTLLRIVERFLNSD